MFNFTFTRMPACPRSVGGLVVVAISQNNPSLRDFVRLCRLLRRETTTMRDEHATCIACGGGLRRSAATLDEVCSTSCSVCVSANCAISCVRLAVPKAIRKRDMRKEILLLYLRTLRVH